MQEHKLKELLNEAIAQTDAWLAMIMVPDFDNGILTTLESTGLPEGWEDIYNTLDKNTYCGTCFMTKEIQLIQNKPLKQPAGAKKFHQISAVVMLPVVDSDSIVAVLEVLSDVNSFTFTHEKIGKIQKLADQMSGYVG